jgi:hypothetical protein
VDTKIVFSCLAQKGTPGPMRTNWSSTSPISTPACSRIPVLLPEEYNSNILQDFICNPLCCWNLRSPHVIMACSQNNRLGKAQAHLSENPTMSSIFFNCPVGPPRWFCGRKENYLQGKPCTRKSRIISSLENYRQSRVPKPYYPSQTVSRSIIHPNGVSRLAQ